MRTWMALGWVCLLMVTNAKAQSVERQILALDTCLQFEEVDKRKVRYAPATEEAPGIFYYELGYTEKGWYRVSYFNSYGYLAYERTEYLRQPGIERFEVSEEDGNEITLVRQVRNYVIDRKHHQCHPWKRPRPPWRHY